uniref:Uncharacterized protein n=1 Tax=Rhizophora mucronata TaxID=61149 RepID=A0A2P2P0Q7_RHIMU
MQHALLIVEFYFATPIPKGMAFTFQNHKMKEHYTCSHIIPLSSFCYCNTIIITLGIS